MSAYKLTTEVIKASEAKVWDEAVLEWSLKDVYEDEAQTCLCGHFPIVEICIIKNEKNRNEVMVGNCCVKKFTGLPSDKIFQAIKRVRKNHDKSLNLEAIKYAFEQKWITLREYEFCLDTRKKRNLSDKQLKWRRDINTRIAFRIKKSPNTRA